jgi:hypothetical protein
MSYINTNKTQTFNLLSNLDSIFLDTYTKRIKLLPASAYDSITRQDLQLWCYYRNRYLLPTVELVDWLKTKIGERQTIEIGADYSDLGHHLGIRSIGNHLISHDTSHTTVLFPGQIPIRVISSSMYQQVDAMQAILEFKPEVVLGAWIPEKFSSDLYALNKYIPNDYQIIQNAEYIHIGSKKIHGRSKLLEFVHETIEIPGLISRTSSSPPDDIIHVWKKLGT